MKSLPRGLFKLCELGQEDLAANAGLMPKFHLQLSAIERECRPAHVTSGQKDLLEPKKKVLARQRAVLKRRSSAPETAYAEMLREKGALYSPWFEKRT